MTENWNEISNDNILIRVGEALQAMRLRQDLSQRELAERAGVSLPTLNRLEGGRANPSLSVLLAILKALGRAEDLRVVFTLEPSPLLLATGTAGERRRKASGKTLRRLTNKRKAKGDKGAVGWSWGDDK